MVLFCFFPSNAAEFIGGISLLHGDVDTLRFSLYLLVFKYKHLRVKEPAPHCESENH